ncbi:MAG: bifunctional DNA-formamidopyrimidine glycosylase/DNA-(apurinic or apyrimidinic site) lyase [Candidatus Paceibacterota bacterium]|jgi:formamidopyrimidine-DNA glycosylase
MPELPEVQTTVNGLKTKVINLTIRDVWSNYNSDYFKGSETIKDPRYFKYFKKTITGKKIISVERRAKNILINVTDGQTILIHMKMTGHLLFGHYKYDAKIKKDPWVPIEPESLKDPYNRHIRLVISLSNGYHLALSDVRRFAKVTVLPRDTAHHSIHLSGIGPEPLEAQFTFDKFKDRLFRKPQSKIKQSLIDQSIIAGIGNIYADETLWRARIHPAEKIANIPKDKLKELYVAIRSLLSKGIKLGGDSMSDYRNVDGEKGKFQEHHFAYRKTGQHCEMKGCKGTIKRIVLGGRSTHYCSLHQVLSKNSI